jgi:hypothetical protein
LFHFDRHLQRGSLGTSYADDYVLVFEYLWFPKQIQLERFWRCASSNGSKGPELKLRVTIPNRDSPLCTCSRQDITLRRRFFAQILTQSLLRNSQLSGRIRLIQPSLRHRRAKLGCNIAAEQAIGF